ncbi:MAG: hypothetical protein AAB152_05710 [Candidatus Coatesbacteria bacterium]
MTLHAATTALGLTAAAAVLWELLARAGASPATWLRHRPVSALDRWGVTGLLGLIAFGTSLLGLALTGLFVPVLVLAALPVVALAGRPRGIIASPMAGAVAEASRFPRLALAALGLGALPAVPWFLCPGVDQDTLAYHLGFPWTCLGLHRMPLTEVPWTFQLSLPFDLAHALPLVLGEDRLARALLLGAAAAATAVVAGRFRGDRNVGWLGGLLALSSPALLGLSTVTKNDLAGAACLVAGGVLWLEAGSLTAAVLLGAAVAVKLTNAPLVALWLLLMSPSNRRRSMPACLAVALLPIAPWLVKAWLATGNPVHPLLWRLFPDAGWGAANDDAVRAMGVWAPETFRPRELLRAWLTAWWRDFPLPALGLVLLAAAGRVRAAAVIAAGSLVTLGAGHMARFVAPSAWLAAVLVPPAIDRLAGRASRTAAALVAFIALVSIWRSPAARTGPWADAGLPVAAVRAADLTTYDAALRSPALLRTRRLLSIGEERTYRLPGRVLYNGFLGETPLVWRLARTSRNGPELARRVRQLGVTTIWYNFVSVERASDFAASFPWNDRMLRLWWDFCRRHLEIRRAPDRVDGRGGGICLFGLRDRPLDPAPATPWFLPGAETAIREARILRDSRKDRDSIRAFERILAVVPGTFYIQNQLGLVYYAMEDWPRAAAAFRPSVRAGMYDCVNLPSYGAAIIYEGALDEAIAVITRSIEVYDADSPNRVNLAWALRERAVRSLKAGQRAASARDLDAAENALAEVPSDRKEFWSEPRREVAALVQASREALAKRQKP